MSGENEKKTTSLQDEINDMFGGMELPVEDEKRGGESDESEEVSESTETGEEATEEVVETGDEEASVEEAPEAAETPAEVVEETAEQKRIRELEERLDKTTKALEDVTAKPKEEPSRKVPEEMKNPLEDFDFEEVTSSKDAFVEFMGKVLNYGQQRVVQDVYRSMPMVVSRQVQTMNTLRDNVEGFFKENKDLLPVRKTVGHIVNETIAENPQMELKEVLKKAGEKTREILGMQKAAEAQPSAETKTPPAKEKKPAFAGSKARNERGGKQPKPTGIEAEIAELLPDEF